MVLLVAAIKTDMKDGIYDDVNSMNNMEFDYGETISKLRHVK